MVRANTCSQGEKCLPQTEGLRSQPFNFDLTGCDLTRKFTHKVSCLMN